MSMQADGASKADRQYYWIVAGLELVPLDSGDVLCCSDTLSVRIEGRFAHLFTEQLAPLLDGQRTAREIAALVHVNANDLVDRLDELARAQVLRCDSQPKPSESRGADEHVPHTFLGFLDAMGAGEGRATLANLRVAFVGLEGPGAHTAISLARAGVGQLVLIDPYACTEQDLALLPPVGASATGRPRAIVLRDALALEGYSVEAPLVHASALARDEILQAITGRDMVVSTFDRGFGAVHHWVNQAGLEVGIRQSMPSVAGLARALARSLSQLRRAAICVTACAVLHARTTSTMR
jgi:ThiF family